MPVLFVLVIAPVLFVLILWVAVTAYRIYNPEQRLPIDGTTLSEIESKRKRGKSCPVGVREIRAAQKRHFQQREQAPRYQVGCGPEGFPENWKESLWRRRN